MAIMWNGSLTPWLDPNGAPRSGAKAYFFNAGTTTPRTVYQDSALGLSHDHPVVANSSGSFPPVFLPGGSFRLRITTADDVTLWDVDGISAPIAESPEVPEGDTPIEFLARTGDYKFRHGTGAHSGWVRANGRTIGNASSGATERASADAEALFLYLWNADTTLPVLGGRGANAASDWAGAKAITLPDLRLRGLIGMASMGGSVSTLIPAATFDNSENGDILGATVGLGAVSITVEQLPPHGHTGSTDGAGSHQHAYIDGSGVDGGGYQAGAGRAVQNIARATDPAGFHAHGFTTNNTGSNQGHPNVQPSLVATCYLKL